MQNRNVGPSRKLRRRLARLMTTMSASFNSMRNIEATDGPLQSSRYRRRGIVSGKSLRSANNASPKIQLGEQGCTMPPYFGRSHCAYAD